MDNAQALSKGLMSRGIRIVSGGTDNHLMLIDLTPFGLSGKTVEKLLDEAHITANKNTIPNDPKSPFVTSGIRLGTPSVTSRGMNTEDMDMKKCVLYALSRVGSAASLDVLADAAASADYTMEYTGANEAYIALIKRLAATEPAVAEKAANSLLKKATKAEKTQTREAALEIILSLQNKEDALKLVVKSMKDESKEYRNAALDFASAFVDEQAYIELVKTMDKAKPEPKIDILNWLGREAKDSAKRETLQKLMIRFDLPAKQVLLDQIGEDYAVSEAAVWALTRIGDVSIIPNLASLLESADKNMVLLAQDALSVFDAERHEDGRALDVMIFDLRLSQRRFRGR